MTREKVERLLQVAKDMKTSVDVISDNNLAMFIDYKLDDQPYIKDDYLYDNTFGYRISFMHISNIVFS